MSLSVSKKLVMKAWRDAWAAGALSDMAVELQNQRFVRPKGEAWGRLTFLPGKKVPASLGPSKFYRTPFALILQIFHPEETGTKEGPLAADIMSVLDNTDRNSPDGKNQVKFGESSLDNVGKVEGFEAFNVTLTGHFDNYTADG